MFQIPKSNSYSFTLTIPHHKQVNYYKKRIKYGYLTNHQQYVLCEDVFKKLFCGENKCDWVYERHEDGRLHIHGYIEESYYEYVLHEIHRFYSDYRINIKPKSYEKIMDIQETILEINYWNMYMDKHQHEIIYKSRNFHEKDHIEALESGAPTQTQTKPQFFEVDKDGLPIIKRYPFGYIKIAPTNKKHIVDL